MKRSIWVLARPRCILHFLPCFVSLFVQTSKDGDHFSVPLAVAKMSELVKSMMDGAYSDRLSDFCCFGTIRVTRMVALADMFTRISFEPQRITKTKVATSNFLSLMSSPKS